MKNCILCGTELNENGLCPVEHKFKKMCINCKYSSVNDNGEYTCNNEDNLNATKQKMLEAAKAVNESYAITDFNITPLPLKKPLCKCKNWMLDEEVLKYIMDTFE